MDICIRCGLRPKKDSKSSWCKECHAEYGREWRKNNKERYTYLLARWRSEKGKEYFAHYMHNIYDRNKLKANWAVSKALGEGRLIKPEICEICGRIAPLDSHHSSYKEEDWLKVEWLCRECHQLYRHSKLK